MMPRSLLDHQGDDVARRVTGRVSAAPAI